MSDEQNSDANSTFGDASKTRSPLEDVKTHAKQAADEFRSAAESKARELREAAEHKARELREKATAKAGEFRERAEGYYGEARARAKTWQEEGETYVRENPLRAVGTALFAGFVVGLLLRKN